MEPDNDVESNADLRRNTDKAIGVGVARVYDRKGEPIEFAEKADLRQAQGVLIGRAVAYKSSGAGAACIRGTFR